MNITRRSVLRGAAALPLAAGCAPGRPLPSPPLDMPTCRVPGVRVASAQFDLDGEMFEDAEEIVLPADDRTGGAFVTGVVHVEGPTGTPRVADTGVRGLLGRPVGAFFPGTDLRPGAPVGQVVGVHRVLRPAFYAGGRGFKDVRAMVAATGGRPFVYVDVWVWEDHVPLLAGAAWAVSMRWAVQHRAFDVAAAGAGAFDVWGPRQDFSLTDVVLVPGDRPTHPACRGAIPV